MKKIENLKLFVPLKKMLSLLKISCTKRRVFFYHVEGGKIFNLFKWRWKRSEFWGMGRFFKNVFSKIRRDPLTPKGERGWKNEHRGLFNPSRWDEVRK
jgi:hypothetical protein